MSEIIMLTTDDVEDLLQDVKDAQNYHDAITRQQRMGHHKKALASVHSIAAKVEHIQGKLRHWLRDRDHV